MSSNKEVQPPEVSLKYMAWNIKEMSESIKRMADMLTVFMVDVQKHQPPPYEKDRTAKEQTLPF